jgi:hypothetical protein
LQETGLAGAVAAVTPGDIDVLTENQSEAVEAEIELTRLSRRILVSGLPNKP